MLGCATAVLAAAQEAYQAVVAGTASLTRLKLKKHNIATRRLQRLNTTTEQLQLQQLVPVLVVLPLAVDTVALPLMLPALTP